MHGAQHLENDYLPFVAEVAKTSLYLLYLICWELVDMELRCLRKTHKASGILITSKMVAKALIILFISVYLLKFIVITF